MEVRLNKQNMKKKIKSKEIEDGHGYAIHGLDTATTPRDKVKAIEQHICFLDDRNNEVISTLRRMIDEIDPQFLYRK
jgi:hypothetical protein